MQPDSSLPSPIQTLLDLFASDLKDVRFGDIDAQTLTSAAAALASAAQELATAEAIVADAKRALHDREQVLFGYAQRALSYARVYAEADATLGARLAGIALPRPSRRTHGEASDGAPPQVGRPRGRPRKVLAAAALDATAE